jgi:predicted RNA polymerase sigma factor
MPRNRADERLREDHQIQQRVADLVHDSYGRLLALLAAPTRDIPAAEDALADALQHALIG